MNGSRAPREIRLRACMALLASMLAAPAAAEEPAWTFGFVDVEYAHYVYVAPEGDRSGLAVVKGGCGSVRREEDAGSALAWTYWCTLESAGPAGTSGVQGWALGVTAQEARIVSISADPLFADQTAKGGFVHSEITSGPGNEGAVSGVLLDLDRTLALPAKGKVPVATLELEVNTPAAGCTDVRVKYTDDLKDAQGGSIHNQVTVNAASRAVALVECATHLCPPEPGKEQCSNGVDDDGDLKIDLEDTDCAGYVRPGDCVLSTCGCRAPFELYFAGDWGQPSHVDEGTLERSDRSSFHIACTNSEALSGLAFGLQSRDGPDYTLHELVGTLTDPAGDPVEVRMIDGGGNPFPPGLPNAIKARKGRISTIERGEDLRAFSENDFLEVNIVSDAEGQAITVRYLVDDKGGGNVLAPSTEREGCAARQLFVVHVEGVFHRGDADGNGDLNLTDPIVILEYLFLGKDAIPCKEAANSNDDRSVDLTDAVYLLVYLFQSGSPPGDPGPPSWPCGPDPAGSPTYLGCEDYTGC
jgi:hypothetical protein